MENQRGASRAALDWGSCTIRGSHGMWRCIHYVQHAFTCTYRALLWGLRFTNKQWHKQVTASLNWATANWAFHSIWIEVRFQREKKIVCCWSCSIQNFIYMSKLVPESVTVTLFRASFVETPQKQHITVSQWWRCFLFFLWLGIIGKVLSDFHSIHQLKHPHPSLSVRTVIRTMMKPSTRLMY